MSAEAPPLEIEYVTHASLLFRTPHLKLLVDPFFFPEDDPILAPSVRNFPPRPIDPAAWGPLDYVYSSHEHHDHCHPQTLARLRDQVRTVLLPAERPGLAARYLELGYRDIRYLENRRPVQLPGGIELTSYWDDPVDTMLLVRIGGRLILHANDCIAEVDTFGEIARRGPVDYAFLCSTSIQQLFPLMLPLPSRELDVLSAAREESFFEGQLPRIDALKPRVVIPYSYTATYLAAGQIHLNCHGRLTPTLYRDRLRARRPDIECWSLQPGDVITAATATEAASVRPIRERNLWGRDLSEFRANLTEHALSLEAELPPFDAGDPADCAVALARHLADRVENGVPHSGFYSVLDERVTLHVAGSRRTESLEIDLSRRTIGPPTGPSRLAITVPASLMASMLAGDYDPFMILYTYRIAFQLDARLQARFAPPQQYALDLGVFLTLFLDRKSQLLEELAALEGFLGVPPTAGRPPRATVPA